MLRTPPPSLPRGTLERRCTAKLAHVVVRPADRNWRPMRTAIDQSPSRALSGRFIFCARGADFGTFGTLPAPPHPTVSAASVMASGSVSIHDDGRALRRCVRPSEPFSAPPRWRPCWRRRRDLRRAREIQSSHRLMSRIFKKIVEVSPPVARCRRLIAPESHWSSTTMVNSVQA